MRSKRNIALDRVAFEECRQSTSESFDDFFIRLRRLADSAELCGNCADTRLATRIMVGIRDAETKKKLLAISPFPGTHEVATICRCEEAASENERTLSGQASVSAVKMRKDWAPSNRPQHRCKACGRTAHTRDNPCPAIGKTCYVCGKADHFSPCCPDRTISDHKEKSKICRVFIGSVSANPRSAPTITLEVLNESGHRIKCIQNVVPDGGAEVTVAGMDAMKEMGLSRGDLVKATFEIVHADTNTPLGNIGQQDICVQYGNAKATIMVVFCPDVTGMLLSWIDWATTIICLQRGSKCYGTNPYTPNERTNRKYKIDSTENIR